MMEPNPTTPAGKPSRKNDTCYNCQKLGHWAPDCPVNHLNKFQPVTPSPVRANIQLLRCNCGSACNVGTSRTVHNPGREFYICSSKECNFFKWCDEVKVDAPVCTCRAGKCSINTDRGNRWYFACRIKKGLGACSFTQWVDSYMQDNLTVTNADASSYSVTNAEASSSSEKMPDSMEIDPVITGNQNFLNLADDQDLGMEALMSCYMMSKKFDEISNTRSSSESEKSSEMETDNGNLSPDHKLAILEEDELSLEDIDKLDYLTDGNSRISCSFSGSEISVRQRDFVIRIDAAGDKLAEDDERLIPHTSTAAAGQAPENNYSLILKKAAFDIQQEFVSRLESNNINPGDLEEEATMCFSALENICLDHQVFKSNVTKYIDSLSKLATMDVEDPTFRDLMNRHSKKKRKFEELCSMQKEKTCKYKACGDKIEELKERMKKIEQEVEQCEAEYVETELFLVEINQKVKRAKRSMEMMDREVEEVRRQREADRVAAKAALDEARLALLEQ